ncbi:MAG: TonB-dependent receptor [Erythrobacter sp.]|uniref:TonB-dependent receptor domain-containing protein n=1 Tax=Erythrobacter sp. TaxID=1042 RepID=UPI003C74AAE8
MKRFNKASLLAGTIMAGALIATPAYAQDSDEAIESGAAENTDADNFIVVTGSRIQRRNVDTAAPIAVVDAEEFQLSGTVNVENVVNTLPQVVPGFTSNSNNPGTGAATASLRGLGPERTLVLVNGRRWMFYDVNQTVDLNTIPSFLIESVDVVTGGASAVYGSDAVAGVVNFRLKEVEGAELGGQYSITEEGDGERYQIYGALGTTFDDGRGSATVFGEYYNRSSIFQGDRGFSNFAIGGESSGAPLQQFGSSTVPQGRINTPGTIAIATPVDLNGDGDFEDDGEAPTAPLASGLIIDDAIFDSPGVGRARAGDTYNYAPANYLQIPQERYLIGGYADYDIGSGHTLYTEVAFTNNRVAVELAATPVTGTFNVDLDTIEPFVSDEIFEEFQQLDENEAAASALRVANGLDPLATAELGVVSTFIQRRTVESGARNQLDERNAFRVLGGVRGPIGDYLGYDAYYSYARTRNTQTQQGNISRSAFQAGLDGTGTPINIFGPNTLTPEQFNAISVNSINSDVSTLETVNASISGTFGDYAIGVAAPIGFAVGAEYRKVGSEFIPDQFLSSGDVIGFNAGQPTEGGYDVKELFAELDIPVEFGSARLDVNGAVRYSDYSLDAVGGVWTYAGGAQFAPIPDITFRGQYQRAIRAPNVAELFGGTSIGFPSYVDPCAQETALTDATIRDLCLATGVPAGSLGVADDVQPNTQAPGLFGGNPDLEEETSNSWTAGVVLRPTFIPGLTVTADYFNVEIEEAISTFGGGLNNVLNLCYNRVQDINDPLCQVIVGSRDSSTGAITTDNPPSLIAANAAVLETSGVDLEVNYSLTIPFSLLTDTGEQGLNLSFLGTWTEKANFTPVAEFPDEVTECAGRFGTTCSATPFFQPVPEFKWTSRASFIDGPMTTSIRWRHLGSVEDDNPDLDYTAFNGVEEIDSYDLVDLTISFEASENFTITAGVNNLFDTLPDTPIFNDDGEVINDTNSLLLGDNQEQANTYPSVYDVLGRDYFVSASFKF